jgi:hypothetical protein
MPGSLGLRVASAPPGTHGDERLVADDPASVAALEWSLRAHGGRVWTG